MEFDANRRISPILCDSYAVCLELSDYSILVGIMRKYNLSRPIVGSMIMSCTVLLNEIQSHHSSTRRALRSPRPANTGLRNDARRKLETLSDTTGFH